MKITITAMMLSTLTNGKFTEEACEAICNHYEEFEDTAPYIGDIMVSFGEIPSEEVEEDDAVLAVLNNGNTVIMY